jgi:hypothetical protein
MSDPVITKAEFVARYSAATRKLFDKALVADKIHTAMLAQSVADALYTLAVVRTSEVPECRESLAAEYEALVDKAIRLHT